MVRLSGPAATDVMRALLAPPPPATAAPQALAARFALTDSLSLAVLVIRARAPLSYTGEDTLEILFPGNPYLAERILARILAVDGVRLAGPGEFTARAYLNGKMTLDEAEGIAATIAAANDEHLAAARRLLAGTTGAIYRRWVDELTGLLALVEAGIDFTDQEDVVPIAPADLHTRLLGLHAAITGHLGAAAGTEVASLLPRVVLAGRANAGKSTLFNALLGRRRAVVSETAGTTRDALEETLDLSRDLPGGCPVALVDLAGLDEALAAAGGPDAQAQERARDTISQADVIVHCDPSGRFDLPLPGSGPTIRVRTKADLPATPALRDASEAAASQAIAVCSLDGWNLSILRRAIVDAAAGAGSTHVASLLPRHRRELLQARAGLAEAIEAINPDAAALADTEIVAGSLRSALDALGELAGRISPDDVIGRIFATFCVGK
jgi:tRNA modification GTPase